MAKTDKERLATGFWNRIESNQATDCNNLYSPATRMANPPSVAANAAALVGIADIALRASKELYSFFSTIKDAPKDIILSTTELQAVSHVLSEIRIFSTEFGDSPFTTKDRLSLKALLSTLRACEKNNKLEHLQQELSRHKDILHTSLSLCGRENDISLRKQADIAQQIIDSLHDSTTEQYQILDGRIQEAASQASQSSLKALNAIQSLESTNIRGFEGLGASASSIFGAIETKTQSLHQHNLHTHDKFEPQTTKHLNNST
ncbi:hypothetical protein OEA41_009674 [Lepraria neglecta]|uniref:Fungal N-terminal domain-containing protein n=1 Tax=Lepraria neglecta TaxID=209136 RepID=A0AAD9Z5C5_9LECA|nr:hypothetical protein OEA41_009674 [Lepraria neglecta]